MNRKEYIDALDGVYKRVKELRDAFGLIRLTDAEPMEDDRRKKTAKMIDDLADRLYEDGAISSRIAADNAAAGKGEQDDLFDDAAQGGEESGEEEAGRRGRRSPAACAAGAEVRPLRRDEERLRTPGRRLRGVRELRRQAPRVREVFADAARTEEADGEEVREAQEDRQGQEARQ